MALVVRRARKKPIEVGGVAQYDGENADEVVRWIEFSSGRFTPAAYQGGELVISTLEGDMHVSPGDWVIMGVSGEFYPCKPDIFDKSYDLLD